MGTMSEMESPTLPPPPRSPSRVSMFIARIRAMPAIAFRKISEFNVWIATKFHTTVERIIQVEVGGLFLFGFTLMQIGEWAAAVACWVLLACIIFVQALAWEGVKGQKGLTAFLRLFWALGAIAGCVVLVTITTLHKPETEPWSNLQKLWQRKPQDKIDAFMQKYGLMSGALKTQLSTEFPLGWDQFIVDRHGLRISNHTTWLPQNEIGNPHRTDFVWSGIGDAATFIGNRISIGLPTILSDQQTIIGNAVSLRPEAGVSLQMDIDPNDSGGVALMRGNQFISDIPGKSPFPSGRNPTFSEVARILEATDDGIVVVLGLKPYGH